MNGQTMDYRNGNTVHEWLKIIEFANKRYNEAVKGLQSAIAIRNALPDFANGNAKSIAYWKNYISISRRWIGLAERMMNRSASEEAAYYEALLNDDRRESSPVESGVLHQS